MVLHVNANNLSLRSVSKKTSPSIDQMIISTTYKSVHLIKGDVNFFTMFHKMTLELCTITAFIPTLATAQQIQPNFVFMMTEDVAPQFVGLYNNGNGAQLPNVEVLASEGIVFNNAYSNAPVSSAARSTLITGCYGPRLGISFHRRLKEVPMPEGLHMFPAYLRQAGYFTANAAKTDYNCMTDTTAWDIMKGKLGAWRNRKKKNQPFLFVRTNATSHESCLHFNANRITKQKTFHSPASVNLLPMHPDTELFRYTYATFYDRIKKVDEELGKIIEMLREDGVLDNTFIFYFGDNGGSLPGSKGYTSEVGLQVPMVAYIPKNFRDKYPVPVNSRVDGFVSFMDLGPTLLHMAGIETPKGMDGTPFMGEDISLDDMNKRDVVYGYGDRFDELYAFNRTVRKRNFKYSRNFFPYHPKSLYALYRYKQMAFNQWKDMYKADRLNKVQSRFFEPQGTEELYDLATDPYETRNLATLPAYQKELKKMRSLLFKHMIDMNDLGLLPECVWLNEGQQDPVTYGIQSHKRLKNALATANLQLMTFSKGKKQTLNALKSTDPVQRYWALTACVNWGKEAAPLADSVRSLLEQETHPYVHSRALVFLAQIGALSNPVQDMKSVLSEAQSDAECLNILNDMAFLKEQNPTWKWDMKESDVKAENFATEWRIQYLNE